jgi:uncharacterized membrane protein SpoIIM required for sporulation
MWHLTMVIFLQTLIVSIILRTYIWTAILFLVVLFTEYMAMRRKDELENESR